MPAGGLFKHLLWIAPVVAILFYFITQKQTQQEDDMAAEFAKFDEDFAHMNGSLSKGGERSYWNERADKAGEKREKAEERASKSIQASDDTFQMMEKELAEVNLRQE